jgi:hypothetical protein
MWFVSNVFVKTVLEAHGAHQVHVVPHPHSNFRNVTHNCQLPAKVVAFTSSPKNRLLTSDWNQLRKLLNDRGLKLKYVPSPDVPESTGASNFWGQDVAHNFSGDIALGVIWPRELDDFTVRWRPNTRLTHWWSHGIPVVFFPYESYVFASAPLPLAPSLACFDLVCVAKTLSDLASNTALRCEIASKIQEQSQLYSYTSIGRMYKKILFPTLKAEIN